MYNNGPNGDIRPDHGPQPSAPLVANEPVSNNVQFDHFRFFRSSGSMSGDVEVPWRTKLQARVNVRLPRLGDLHASDYSDPTINTTRYGTSDDGNAPGPVGTTSWYPDFGVSNHVCRASSALRDVIPYSSKSSLLMGDGSPAMISSIGQGILPTTFRMLDYLISCVFQLYAKIYCQCLNLQLKIMYFLNFTLHIVLLRTT